MSKIKLKDYIGWVIALVVGIAAIIFRRENVIFRTENVQLKTQNVQLENKQQQAYNSAIILEQNNYFGNAPQDTKAILDTIIANTAPSSTLEIKK